MCAISRISSLFGRMEARGADEVAAGCVLEAKDADFAIPAGAREAQNRWPYMGVLRMC